MYSSERASGCNSPGLLTPYWGFNIGTKPSDSYRN
jgi:hypothetical protein